MTDHTATVKQKSRSHSRIGPLGTASRILVGALFITLAILWGPSAWDVALGMLLIPGAVTIAMLTRGRQNTHLRMYGPGGHLANCAIAAGLFAAAPVAALLFYGISMLVAVTRGYAGCELLAISNLVTRRNDEIACPVFTPIDQLDARISSGRS